ncbi:mismatch repair endonuclease PMS2 [Orussus abietinus]|uniref:mismatch repair endonuclease PMS2 n=1 Tax=Orussus abietinus TaxID=222816 RepID=UPI0006267386|nr:mismatch repair endonuclease PMS2 [Orussus abietinus]
MTEPTVTTEISKKINAISKEAVHHICSGQVVLDLAIAIKELVENSLDSGATVIDVKLSDYGKTSITVNDNGSGVSEQDFEGLALKHHTSKLREFSDLSEVDTFGFRGEALSSLAALSELSIITRHKESEHAFHLQFDKNGQLKEKTACARGIGTTVYVKNIFKNLPVRAKEFQKNFKKEYAKALQILYGYCLVSTGIKITCSNLISGKSSNVVATMGAASILENINSVFGRKSLDGIVKVEINPLDEATLEEYNLPKDTTLNFSWDFYVSSCAQGMGRSTPDRQFFYVNGRPCDLTKISKLLNQTYHKYNNKQYPFVFLNLKLHQECADVNVTPDKRTIFFTQEKLILAAVKWNLIQKWDGMQGSFTMKSLEEMNFSLKRINSPSTAESPPTKRIQLSSFSKNVERQVDQKEIHTDNTDINCTERLPDTEMTINMELIKQALLSKERMSKTCKKYDKHVKYRSQIKEGCNAEAEKELQLQLQKGSFNKMEVIGQFNLGFIIVQLEEDLFIVDQHATDEKYRFEKLNNETKLTTQKLIIPKALNLAALNESILIEHQQVFEDNGFTFEVNETGEAGHRVMLTGMPVSGGWQFGQEDIEELIFLIRESSSEACGNNKIIRPSRVRQMLASRACRSAVMVGTALGTLEMQRLLVQMDQMQNPWNCPHGRPTIRHLLSLALLKE